MTTKHMMYPQPNYFNHNRNITDHWIGLFFTTLAISCCSVILVQWHHSKQHGVGGTWTMTFFRQYIHWKSLLQWIISDGYCTLLSQVQNFLTPLPIFPRGFPFSAFMQGIDSSHVRWMRSALQWDVLMVTVMEISGYSGHQPDRSEMVKLLKWFKSQFRTLIEGH